MFDAINAIEREFEPYHVRLRTRQRIARRPRRRRRRTTCSSPSIPRRRPPMTRCCRSNSATGRPASSGAARPSAPGSRRRSWRGARTTAGSVAVPAYSEPLLPGRWQPTPPNNAVAAFTHLPAPTPLALLIGDAVPAAAAAGTDQRALRARRQRGQGDRQVRQRRRGRLSRRRSPGCGRASRLRQRHAPPLFAIWNNVARDVARDAEPVAGRDRPGVRADERRDSRRPADHAGQQVRLRPVAPGDGDSSGGHRPQPRHRCRPDVVVADHHAARIRRMPATWLSSAPAPPARCSSRSAPTTSRSRAPGVSRAACRMSSHQFAGFWEAARGAVDGRGSTAAIHYRFDQDAGQQIGKSVAEFVFANFMTPRRQGND